MDKIHLLFREHVVELGGVDLALIGIGGGGFRGGLLRRTEGDVGAVLVLVHVHVTAGGRKQDGGEDGDTSWERCQNVTLGLGSCVKV